PFYLRAYDMHDYPLLRDKLFSLVTTKESFYIRELRRPSEFTTCDGGYDDRYVGGKRYLVRLSNVIELDQQRTYGFCEMVFDTTELPFAESIGTSADIDSPELIPLVPGLWEQGYIDLNGNLINRSTSVRTKNNLPINQQKYVLKSINGGQYFLRFYDRYGVYFSGTNINAKEGESVTLEPPPQAHTCKVYVNSNSGDITPSMIGNQLKASLRKETYGINSDDELWGFGMGLIADDDSLIYTHTGTEFKIFNPGVEVHPFEQDLVITISD